MRPPDHSPRDLTDRVFLKTLENVDNLREFLEEALPNHIAALDCAHARLLPREFVATVQRDSRRRKEIKTMGQTIAESLMEEGQLKQARRMLLQALKGRFRKVPKAVKTRIEQTTDLKRLETVLFQAMRLEKLEDLQL